MNENKNDRKERSSIPQLVQCLSSDSYSTVYKSLINIRSKLSSPCKIKEFHESGGIKAILPLLEKPKLLELTISVLANCCLDSQARDWILENNGLTPIVQAFKCLASESVQNRCCRALANLALSPRGSFLLHKEGILSVVVKFLTETTDPHSQQTAIRAIRLLTSGSFYKSLLVEEDGIVPVTDLLRSDNQKVVLSAIKTLASLTEYCKQEIAQQVQRSEGLPSVILLCSSDDKECKENALMTLVNLSTQSVIRPVLGNMGAVTLLIKLIEYPETEKPPLFSLVTALCFYCRESCSRVKIRDNDGLKVLLNILQQQEFQAVHDRIVFSLLAFRYDEASLDVLMELGLVSALIEQLNKFIEENQKNHSVNHEDDTYESNTSKEAQNKSIPEPRRILPNRKGNEISKDEEAELLNAMKLTKLSKVFCIHSPSYQLVQNEVQSDIGRITDVKDMEPKYQEGQSPLSVNSYCLSPDASSLDWSLPGSPINSRLSWSPSPSPTSASTSSQDMDFSPAQPNNSIQFSPVLNDNFSDVEGNVNENEQSISLNDGNNENEQQRELSNSIPKIGIPKRKHRKRINSESSSPNASKLSRRHSTASTSSSFSSLEVRNYNPKGREEDETIGGQIIQLLSHLSHMEKHCVSLATRKCVKSILNYLCNLPFISPRAKRLLLRLLGNYKCFELLILFDIVDLINENINLKHIPSVCQFCAKLNDIKQKLITVLCTVSESGYGIGILSHIILTGTSEEIAKCVLSIPHLIRGHYQLRKLLCDCGGLGQLLQLLDGEYQGEAVQSLSALCQNCFSNAFKSYSMPKNNLLRTVCIYNNITHDIEFTLDNNTVVKGNRSTLSTNSEYFNAMLEGSFLESQKSQIRLEFASSNALLTIFHHLHGCNALLCSPLKENDVTLNLELLTLCDRFMIDKLSKIVEAELMLNLTPEMVKTIYAHSVKYNCEDLSTAVLKYVMVGEMSPIQRQNCFSDLKSSPSISKVFIGDIKDTILRQFPESKIASKQILEDQVCSSEYCVIQC